jgi:hypothetical protein
MPQDSGNWSTEYQHFQLIYPICEKLNSVWWVNVYTLWGGNIYDNKNKVCWFEFYGLSSAWLINSECNLPSGVQLGVSNETTRLNIKIC